tara:strand:+ start:627 stop:1061 length:435 start_codon:yes stop_codon:yes gene_type:complete
MSIPLKHLFHINASVDKVFKALTNVNEMRNWYTTEISGESSIDQLINFKFGTIEFIVKVTALEVNKKIVWECVDTTMPFVGHTYTFELDESDAKTRILLTVLGFEEQNDMYANMNFSWGKYLESLRQYCQKGLSEAFGSSGYRS